MAGWPMFAVPGYGGNKIPERYLNSFNAETDSWLKRIGARKESEPMPKGVPGSIADFAKDL